MVFKGDGKMQVGPRLYAIAPDPKQSTSGARGDILPHPFGVLEHYGCCGNINSYIIFLGWFPATINHWAHIKSRKQEWEGEEDKFVARK